MSRLTDLIAQTKARDPTLGADLEAEFRVLQERRQFGLNFERHRPEAVELPQRPVRKGDKVRVLPPRGSTKRGDQRLWRVTGFDDADGTRVARLVLIDGDETQHVAVDDLVVVAEFRDPIYPGLVSTGRLERGSDKPFHTVINAENYHALQTLLYTHRSKVDCIYIDPPYATGKDDWIYSDRHVDADDHYRHSKWLAFMERRLRLARELLKDTGVIIVAIGDDQHHRLRLLMDQVFDESNFISDVVWQGGRKNDSRYVSNGADYMLIYARSEAVLAGGGVRWRERKPGLDEVMEAAKRIWAETEGDHSRATTAWRAWMRDFKKRPDVSDAVTRYTSLDERTGEPIFTGQNISWPGGGGPRYDLLHPVTGQPVQVPKTGWRYTKEDMLRLAESGRVRFGPDHNSGVQGVSFLSEMDQWVAGSVFDVDRRRAARHTETILGDKRFPFAKDHEVLMRWLNLVAPADATVLDFFGGSGTTLEAVARLNSRDGGQRRCIVVTNNEVGSKEARAMHRAGLRKGDPDWEAKGVYEYVTRPRIVTVLSGIRPDGSKYPTSVDANVEFFDLTYETPWRVARNRDFAVIAPLLWLRAGSQGRRIDAVPEQGWDVADTYGVLVDLDRVKPFLAAAAEQGTVRVAFVVTDDDRRFQMVCAALPEHVEPVRLYESYLRNFQINTGRE